MPHRAWQPASLCPSLNADGVHVWRASLDLPTSDVDRLLDILSPDERATADAFRFKEHRDRYIVAHGILRRLLSLYARAEPGSLRFLASERGKSELVQDPTEGRIAFNLSHSRDLALFAVARDRRVGVDVEWMRAVVEADRIAERFFSLRERAALQRLSGAEKQTAFFRCWTRKEAFLKATGDGLGYPLDRVEVSLSPQEPAALLGIGGNLEEAVRWRLEELSPGAGYVGALVVEGRDWNLSCWHWASNGSTATLQRRGY